LDDEVTNILLNAVKERYVTVEREGISLRYPCHPLLIATFNPEEGELKDHFLDRIGVALSAESHPLNTQERVQVVDNVMDFTGSFSLEEKQRAEEQVTQALTQESDLTTSVIFAREILKDVKITHEQTKYLCEEAIRADIEGHRGDIFAAEVAKANAALQGRTSVNARDLQLAVQLAIAPRGRWVNTAEDDQGMPHPTATSPPSSGLQGDSQQQPEEPQNEKTDQEEQQEEREESETNQDETRIVPDLPQEFMFAADATPIDPKLLQFANLQRRGKGRGRRNKTFSNVSV
jgi:magnesium chelatase subunit D